MQFYTHVSDQYAPFHTKVINVTVRDATHVLDGLLYHESDLRIEEHYTDTTGFTNHVFALMHLLGFRFVPRGCASCLCLCDERRRGVLRDSSLKERIHLVGEATTGIDYHYLYYL